MNFKTSTATFVSLGAVFGILLGLVLVGALMPSGFHIGIVATILVLSLLAGITFTYAMTIRNDLQENRTHLESATEINRTKDEFISMVLHHLRTPLSGMKWALEELLKETSVSDLLKKSIQEIHEANERALKAVTHLLEASQASMERLEYTFEVVSLKEFHQLVEAGIHAMEPQIRIKELALSVSLSAQFEGFVKIDKEKITTIVQLLVENAITYTPSKGSIIIKTLEQGGYVVFEVADTGIGIPPEDQKKIFIQFYRATNARKFNPEGFGVGMFLVKKFLEHHQGDIELTSQLEKGTTVRFRIPLYLTKT